MKQKRICAVFALAVVLAVFSACEDGGQTQRADTQQSDTELVNTETEKGTEISGATETVDGTEGAWESSETVDVPEYPEILSDKKVKSYGNVVRVGDTAYECYVYAEEAADSYAMTINKAAEALDGQAQVYNIVVPLGSGIVFPDNLRDQVNFSDQQEAVSQIQGKMDSGVRTVDIYDSLMTHRDEYIYFRTDHHWTARGAYYAYEDFCEAKGIVPEELEGYETKEFDGFLGSFYKDTNNSKAMYKNPDVVTAYLPHMDAICHVEDSQGVLYDSNVIYDETNAAAGMKYSAFIAGDNPYTEIVNSELTDGSSCIVVKESFGNAFVPFLVDHYETIYVIDYRYWAGSISKLAAEKGISDVVFVNNLSMICNKSQIGKLYRVI